MPEKNIRLVYSTDGTDAGRLVAKSAPKPAAPPRKPASSRQPAPPPNDGIVRVQRTSKGHGGKTVTIITGLPGTATDLEALLKVLKQHCGAGGTRDAATLEIQGDHRDKLVAKLEALGHTVKLAGG